jgi:hypothetical protein
MVDNDVRWDSYLPNIENDEDVFALLLGGKTDSLKIPAEMGPRKWFERVAEFLQSIHTNRKSIIK